MFRQSRLLFLLLCSSLSYHPLLAVSGPELGTLTGTVTDKADGKPIFGATISIPDLKTGTATDANGKFSITLATKGIHLVQVSFVGYATYNQNVDFTVTSHLEVQLALSTIEAGEVVVTGVSKATEIKRAPIPIVAVGKSYMDQHSASGNVIDAVANLPGISAVTTGPNISKPFIHGLGYNRVVTLEDGIRQEGQQWGDEHGIEVDQNSIDRIEIIKGPASLTYGSDAIGGVVNLLGGGGGPPPPPPRPPQRLRHQ
jgi:iron complex outermembrane receptor protein